MTIVLRPEARITRTGRTVPRSCPGTLPRQCENKASGAEPIGYEQAVLADVAIPFERHRLIRQDHSPRQRDSEEELDLAILRHFPKAGHADLYRLSGGRLVRRDE